MVVSEQRYRQLFQHAQVGICQLHLDETIVEANQTLADILGVVEAEELIDTKLQDHLEEPQQWESLCELVVQQLEVQQREIILRDREGRPVYLLVNAGLRQRLVHEPVIEASLLDLTDRRRTNLENVELREHLRRLQRQSTVSSLSNGIVHDFNNQMTIILSAVFVNEISLDQGELSPDEVQEGLDAIKLAAENAAKLSRQLLSHVRGDDGGPEPLDVNAAIRQTVRLLSWTAEHNILLQLDFEEGLPSILSDSCKLHQCVLNLCLNACQAMKQGGTLTIATRHVQRRPDQPGPEKGWVEVKVTDTGEGMTEEVRQRAFEAFFSTKHTGEESGTGLGLWMVNNIMKTHRGTIEVESVPQQGSTFTLRFPAQGEDAAEPAPASRVKIEPNRGTIVFADDDPALRKIVGSALQKLGFHVLKAANGKEAVSLVAQDQGLRLVILDAVMPLMDGEAAFRKIRKTYPELPVLFTTGFIVTGRLQSALSEPRVSLLLKPFEPRGLVEAVTKLIES